jgi:hypothetical protein
MKSVICTIFESHYHFGVAGLVNSLYSYGFKGDIYAGYLGSLPYWAKVEQDTASENTPYQTFSVNENVKIHFVPLKTDYHLANYKPDFMKWLLDGPAKDADNIFYFDPDIVINYKWSFFEEWVSYGVAVCEDVNSPLSLNHPRRKAWEKYFSNFRIPIEFTQNSYANSGFIGVNRKDEGFISSWTMIQEKIAPLIGGLNRSPFPGEGHLSKEHSGNYAPYSRTDQDALNVAIGTWNGVVSFTGREAMGFQQGPALMFHALGPVKPWEARFLWQSIKGKKPRRVDKKYWKFVSSPINLHSDNYIFRKNLAIRIAAFVGRFYARL